MNYVGNKRINRPEKSIIRRTLASKNKLKCNEKDI